MNKRDLLGSLPSEWPEDLLPAIQARLRADGRKVVVLDDDPTGTQTVHSIPVLTEWSVEALRAELEKNLPAFYVLTNSRSLPLPEAQALNREDGCNLGEAARCSGRGFAVVSRSDSTLRGHFPGEVEALAGALEIAFDAWLIIPFFLEGGRYTIHDVHYVAEDETLIPAGETSFARDAVFGYRASDLRAWVEEKTAGRIRASDVASTSIDTLRRGGPSHVTEQLLGLPKQSVCVVNAASYRDLEVRAGAARRRGAGSSRSMSPGYSKAIAGCTKSRARCRRLTGRSSRAMMWQSHQPRAHHRQRCTEQPYYRAVHLRGGDCACARHRNARVTWLQRAASHRAGWRRKSFMSSARW